MSVLKVTTSPEAWKLLNGIVCVYKQASETRTAVLASLKHRICEDLNRMKTRPQLTHVEIRRLKSGQESPREPGRKVVSVIQDGSGDRVEVVEGPSYADHPAVIGPRHQITDFSHFFVNPLGRRTSGISVIALNGACRTGQRIVHSKWIREFRVSGVFGVGTKTFFADGPIVEKATFHKVKRHVLEKLLAKSQSSHQRLMYQSAGVPLHSQRAYELASKGLLRPVGSTIPLVYSLKLVEFDPPNFEIEVKIINETEEYFATLLHEFGLKMNTVAACTKIRCTKYGPFELKHTLLRKHFGIESVLNNMQETAQILQNFDMNVRDPLLRVTTGPEDDEETLLPNEDQQKYSEFESTNGFSG